VPTAGTAGVAKLSTMGSDVAIEPLDTDNYATWSVRMRAVLIQKGLWQAVQDTGAATGAECAASAEADQKALALLILCVKDHHLAAMSACATACEAWTSLESVYKSKSVARRQQLKRELNHLKKLPTEPVTKFVGRARALWNDLAAAGEKIEEADIVWAALNGLPAEYATLIEVLETTGSPLKLDEALSKLLKVEQRIVSKDEVAGAYVARSGQQRFSSRVQPAGRSAVRSSAARSSTVEQRKCYYCGKPGHIKAECRKRMREEANSSGARPVVALMASLGLGGIEDKKRIWALDSGASRHVTPYAELLDEMIKLDSAVIITLANNEKAVAQYAGSIKMTAHKTGIPIMLRDVLYVPDMGVNLFSVQQAAAFGAHVKFSSGGGVVMKGGEQLIKAKGSGGLYTFTVDYGERVTALVAATRETPELWHRRFGHLGYNSLAKLPNMVTGINVGAAEFRAMQQAALCPSCALGKQNRLPFPAAASSGSSKEQPLGLVHMDVCGPMPVASLGGSRYVATFLDDYTRLSVIIPVATKSVVQHIVKNVLNELETQSGNPVKAVRTDRGGEYLNAELKTYLQSKGIVHEMTAPYTPEQNGAAERLNRTLVERTRAMLLDADLDEKLWAEAMMTANYIRNRSPTTDKTKTPLEMFYKAKPDVTMMRTFGCRAYVLIPKILRCKLDPVSQPGIFVGYEPHSKAYRILLEDKHKITVSRDVLFDETTVKSGGDEAAAAVPTTIVETDSEDTHSDNAATDYNQTDTTGSGDSTPQQQQQSQTSEGAATATAQRRYPQRERRPPGEYWASVAAVEEPLTYEDALRSPNADKWRAAMDEEMASLQKNKTWTLEKTPEGVG